MSLIIDGTSGVTFNDSSLQGAAASPYVLKNRIINGDMRIDQRYAGATNTGGNGYTIDRWTLQYSQSAKFNVARNLNSVTLPTGFTNYLGSQVSSAVTIGATDFFFQSQAIEGYNFADLGWGTANAKTITISFQVYSSLTGTFGGSLTNYAFNRCYPFTYTISNANTWTTISVTIAGDTSGTWVGASNAGAAWLIFGMGVGSTYSGTAGAWSGTSYYSATGAVSVVGTGSATFYITGVQLEIGSSATPFERRLYNQELANCQRYYYRISLSGSYRNPLGTGLVNTTSTAYMNYVFLTTMRTSPTSLEQSGTASDYRMYTASVNANCTSVPTVIDTTIYGSTLQFTSTGAIFTLGQGVLGTTGSSASSAYLGWSAEL